MTVPFLATDGLAACSPLYAEEGRVELENMLVRAVSSQLPVGALVEVDETTTADGVLWLRAKAV